MHAGQVIVLATPVFLLLIAIEFAVARRRARQGRGGDAAYGFADALGSLNLGMLSQVSAVLTGLLRIGIYTAVYAAFERVPDSAFWSTWHGGLLALVFYDFCYYWQHRMGHECAVLWAAHVVHHQSQHYNLTTALRQTSSGALLGWIFYLPMALAGVPPGVFGVVALVDLLYQFWVHTEQVGRLGGFDRWFCSPSNHRVHHAVNDRYLDRNYGGILLVWDRLFGTFQPEDERCVYGTRSPLQSWDPLWANAEVYWSLAKDSWHARRWADKLRVWLKPPGWRPPDVAARFPKPAFDIAKVTRYNPAAGRMARVFATGQFALLLAGVAVFLWHAHALALPRAAVWLAALVAGLWATGAVLQGRLGVPEALFVDAAALATLSAALGLGGLHFASKPLALEFAILFVAMRASRAGASGRFDAFLLAALAASLAGDVLLMLSPRFFVPGLACFLLAHLAYLGLFRLGVGLFPRRGALAATLAVGAAVYACLWLGGLPAGLRAPVGAYVAAIACMAAQAIGRAAVLQDAASRWVAAGACCFMLSDALLAVNRFVAPLPLASLWVLASYYAAQGLIVRHARPTPAAASLPREAAPGKTATVAS